MSHHRYHTCCSIHFPPPQDGSPDEQLVIDLAAELSDQFEVESLEMYNTLQEVWSYANKTDYATAKLNNKTVMVNAPIIS